MAACLAGLIRIDSITVAGAALGFHQLPDTWLAENVTRRPGGRKESDSRATADLSSRSGAGFQLVPSPFRIATARVHPADAPRIFMGKQATVNPLPGNDSRLCSFSRWQ